MAATAPNSYPWLVIDTTGTHESTGCWHEGAATDLADRLSTDGFHIVIGRPLPELSPVPRGPMRLAPAEPWPCAGAVIVAPAQDDPRRERGLNRLTDATTGWRWRNVGAPNLIGPRRLRRKEAVADAEAAFENITGWTKRKNTLVADVEDSTSGHVA